MTWVKICGITNLEDALVAVEAGADALGFVFCEKSPRNLDVKTAREIVAKLPERVEKIGVFVDEPAEKVSEIAKNTHVTGVQLHGSEDVAFARQLKATLGTHPRIFKAVPVNLLLQPSQGESYVWDFASMGVLNAEDAEMSTNLMRDTGAGEPAFQPGPIRALILDSGRVPGEGGTGRTFDWKRFRHFVDGVRGHTDIIVAGGLTPANVGGAMRILHPWGVDVSSGVEAHPGKKDPDKVKAFIAAVCKADQVH